MLVEAAFSTYQGGDYQGAISRLENARSYSETGYLYYKWGIIERDEGRFGTAREKFQRSTELDPKRLPTWRSWGRMEQRLGNEQRAVNCFEQAIGLPWNDCQDHHVLGVSLSKLAVRPHIDSQARSELLERAETALRNGFFKSPVGYRETHHNVVNGHSLALSLQRRGRKKEALIHYRNGLRLEPGNERLIDLQLSLR